eukprot:gene21639-25684_t
MARTMTVDLGDELREFIESLIESGDYRTQSEVIRESLRLLREKQAESRLQALRDMLAEGLSSGEAQPWEKDAFLRKDLEGIWYYSYHHFGEPQADRYVEHLSDVLQILSNNNIGTPRPELGEGIFVLPFERHVIYFLQSPEEIIVIRILNQNQY